MNQRLVDIMAGVLIVAVIVTGGALSWQAYQQQLASDQMMGSMMGASMEGAHGINPVWYIVGTFIVTVALAAIYLSIRSSVFNTTVSKATVSEHSVLEDVDDTPSSSSEKQTSEETEQKRHPRNSILDVLPEDERRVIEPVLTSPGITQIELRDRSDFSKSKVSQTVSELEKRGLLYRERQGRTYRIYPSDKLRQSP